MCPSAYAWLILECLWIIICGASCGTLWTQCRDVKKVWSVMYLCTWGHGNGLILHPVSKGTKMALMQHLRKNPPIRGIILQSMTTSPILFNDCCYLWLVLLLASETAVLKCVWLSSGEVGGETWWAEDFISSPFPPSYFLWPACRLSVFHLSHPDVQLAGRGTKENKCSMKAVEEMLESMQITMS